MAPGLCRLSAWCSDDVGDLTRSQSRALLDSLLAEPSFHPTDISSDVHGSVKDSTTAVVTSQVKTVFFDDNFIDAVVVAELFGEQRYNGLLTVTLIHRRATESDLVTVVVIDHLEVIHLNGFQGQSDAVLQLGMPHGCISSR